MIRKLLLVGPDSVHTRNYYQLIKESILEVEVVTGGNNTEPQDRFGISFSIRNPLHIPGNVSRLRRVIEKSNPDLVHVHQANSVSFITLLANKSSKRPLVITAWGSDILLAGKLGPVYRKMLRYNLRHASGVTADASFMIDEMNAIAGKKLNTVIANFGIDLPVNPSFIKEKMIFSNRAHDVLYRIDRVILAFAEFKKSPEGQGWKLVVGGKGENTEKLKKLATDLGMGDRVVFPGWMDKKMNDDFYSRASLFVSFPESDATSISLLEAMAYECIPIVSDLPANREWVAHGRNGLLVSALSGQAFSDALALDRETVVAINRKVILEKGTKEANREKFMDLYNRLVRE